MSISPKQWVIIDILGNITKAIYNMIKRDRLKGSPIVVVSVLGHDCNTSFIHYKNP